jgi:hypothetical protein
MFESSPSRRVCVRRHCDLALAAATLTKRAPPPVRVSITKD